MLMEALKQSGLSHREAEVAKLINQGITNQEAADRLFVTEKTIKFHLTRIYRKLKVKSRTQLILWCMPHIDFAEKEADKRELEKAEPHAPFDIPAGNSKIGNA